MPGLMVMYFILASERCRQRNYIHSFHCLWPKWSFVVSLTVRVFLNPQISVVVQPWAVLFNLLQQPPPPYCCIRGGLTPYSITIGWNPPSMFSEPTFTQDIISGLCILTELQTCHDISYCNFHVHGAYVSGFRHWLPLCCTAHTKI